MKNRIIIALLLVICISATACSKAPELLEPLGFDENSMSVKRGDMYNITKTENVVLREVEEVAVRSDAIVKSVNVALGDEVKAGDVLISLDGASVAAQAAEIDEKIASMEKDNEYLNAVNESRIKVAELEYEKLKASGATAEELSSKQTEIADLQNSYYQSKVEQDKELSELRLTKMDAGNMDTDIVAPCDGVVMYLSNWNSEEMIAKDTIVAVIGKTNTKVIQGEYLEEEFINSCDEFYALINGKRYEITNDPLDPNMVAVIDVFGGVLQNTYYINEASDEIKYGDIASVIFIKDRKENVLYIPDDGIYEDIDGYYVYVKNEKGEKVRRDVEVGMIWETAVEITKGLEEGETIYGK